MLGPNGGYLGFFLETENFLLQNSTGSDGVSGNNFSKNEPIPYFLPSWTVLSLHYCATFVSNLLCNYSVHYQNGAIYDRF